MGVFVTCSMTLATQVNTESAEQLARRTERSLARFFPPGDQRGVITVRFFWVNNITVESASMITGMDGSAMHQNYK